MKTTSFLVIISLVLANYANAQDNKPTQYLFGNNGKTSVTGFGAPIVQFWSKGGDFAVSSGGGGAVLINQTFFFGGYGMGMATVHNVENLKVFQTNGTAVSYPTLRTNFGHGGLWLGYINNRKAAVHWGVSAKIGGGAINLMDADYDMTDHKGIGIDGVFVFIPQVEMEMNINRWFKINIGAGYQLVSGVDKTYINASKEVVKYYNSSDYNSPQLSISFLFGGFGS